MFSPYLTIENGEYGASTSIDFFNEFIDFMIVSTEDAKEIRFGNERTDITKSLLTWWAARIKCYLAAETDFSFLLGDYIKEINSYKSNALDVLFDLISPIDSSITKRSIATAIQKINKSNQLPASFIVT
jgi:hypothetical protein